MFVFFSPTISYISYLVSRISSHPIFSTSHIPHHSDTLPSISPHLYKRIRKVVVEVIIPKTRRRALKIRILNRTPRRSRHTLPRNQRLLAALLIARNELMIDRPDTNIPDLGPRARERRARVLLVLAVRRDSDAADRGRVRGAG
jgi:hypothetical protein